MSKNPVNTIADSTLPLLVTLVAARKQARWQWANSADEHKHKWTVVIAKLDTRIAAGESVVGCLMGIEGFRTKREVVE